MDDLLTGVIAVIAEILAEAFVEIAGEALVSLGAREIGKLF